MESTREALEALMSCSDCETCLSGDLCDDAPAIAEIALSLLDERDRYREALTLVTAWLDNTRCRHDCATCEHLHSCGTYSAIAAARDALEPAQKEAARADEAGQ